MAWKRIEITETERTAGRRAFGQTARFLLDEDVDPELARALSNLGYNSTSVRAGGLAGRQDEDVLALAKRQDRILITNDRGFADERRFPEHRNPGVVIVPAGPLDDEGVITALRSMLPVVGRFRPLFRGAVVSVDRAGVLSVTDREHASGARRTTRYRDSREGSFYWEDDAE